MLAILPVHPRNRLRFDIVADRFTDSRKKAPLPESLEQAKALELVLDAILHLGKAQVNPLRPQSCLKFIQKSI